MTTTNPDQGDERRAFEQHIEDTENRKPTLWSHVFANSGQECPARDEGVYFLTADQRAWLAWQARAALAAPQPSQGANVKVGGSTVYVTNNHRRESNRWWATVYPGFDDDDKRVSTEECDAIANWIADALNAAPHPPVSAEAGKGVIHQFRKKHCSDWYDGFPDTEDGGPYETRTLYAHPSESVAVSGEVSDVAIDSAISTVWEDWEDDIDRRRELARAVLALAGSGGKKAAALERMARLDDEIGDAP